MKKFILPMIAAALTTASGLASEEKTKISLCQSDECTVAGDEVKLSIQQTREHLVEVAHNDSIVMKHFDALSDVLIAAFHKEKSITSQEVAEICSGINFAAEKHRLQTRKNKEKTPYISHPIGVAYNLMQVGEVRDSSIIIGALLHDTIEDTQTTFEEIEAKFGAPVANLVKEVTDDKSLAQEARKRLQVINAAHKSPGAAQIKLADNLCNLNDLFKNPPADWSQARIDRYYEWSRSVVDRLPKANGNLHKAVESAINNYWEKQEASKT